MVGRPAWYDVEMRGRRLEVITKQMNTSFWNKIKTDETELALSYLDRILKIENTLQPYIEQITGVKKLIKEGQKIAPNVSV